MILDGAAVAAASPLGPAPDPRSYLLACYPEASIPPLDHVVGTADPLVARVNHGLWMASCSCGAPGLPTPGCVVFLDVPLGWCVRCGNKPWGGGWRPVVVPPAEERRQIEAVLRCRPNVGDRNWEPHETIADLAAQNLEHGDPVPDFDEPPAEAPAPVPRGPRWPSDAARAVLAGLNKRRGLLRALGRR